MMRAILAFCVLLIAGAAHAAPPQLNPLTCMIPGSCIDINRAIASLPAPNGPALNLVTDCGAIGGSTIANTPNETSILNACLQRASPGGTVVLPTRCFRFDPFTIPANTFLSGGLPGAPESASSAGAAATGGCAAPTIIINSYTTSFALIAYGGGLGPGIQWYDPNQVSPSSSTPTGAPYVITVPQAGGGCTIAGQLIVNAYEGINIQSGRCRVYDNKIGAFAICLSVDAAVDTTYVSGNDCKPFWDIYAGLGVPQTIDTWVLANRIGFLYRRADEVQGSNNTVFYGNIGLKLTDTALGLNPSSGYGQLANYNLDAVNFGVYADSTQCGGGGFKLIDFDIEAPGAGGTAALNLPTGGNVAPCITWQGGSVLGTWSVGNKGVQIQGAGVANIRNVYNLNPYGAYTAPGFPATGVGLQNNTGFEQRIFVTGGTFSSVSIGSTTTGITASPFQVILEPQEAIVMSYTGSPTWKWFAN